MITHSTVLYRNALTNHFKKDDNYDKERINLIF